jgi:hypothetical protein
VDGGAEILEDIQEALSIARVQKQITPVRITRILAGESTEQFSGEVAPGVMPTAGPQAVPLSVALEYVGMILDDSRKEIMRLKVSEGSLWLPLSIHSLPLT